MDVNLSKSKSLGLKCFKLFYFRFLSEFIYMCVCVYVPMYVYLYISSVGPGKVPQLNSFIYISMPMIFKLLLLILSTSSLLAQW